jgi:hypothetical protein
MRQPGVKKNVQRSAPVAPVSSARADANAVKTSTADTNALTAARRDRISVAFNETPAAGGVDLNRALIGIAFVPVFIVGAVVGFALRPSSVPEATPVMETALAPAASPSEVRKTPPKPEPKPAEVPSKPEAKPAPQPEAAAAPQDGFGLAPAKKHYGKVLEGQARTHVFKIERPDAAAIRIGRTYSPCPCVFVSRLAVQAEIPDTILC